MGCRWRCNRDRLNVFLRKDKHWTLAEQLRGAQNPTHFGRMLEALGIGFIAARSPQAKGRVERLWQTLQDRLVCELRLQGITTGEAANAFLPSFIADYNRRFTRPPRHPEAAWRRPPRDLVLQLACRYTRQVAADNTVALGLRWVQLPPGPARRSWARRRVDLRELLDGQLVVLHDGRVLATAPPPAPDFVLRPRRAARPRPDRRGASPGARTPGGRYGPVRRSTAEVLGPGPEGARSGRRRGRPSIRRGAETPAARSHIRAPRAPDRCRAVGGRVVVPVAARPRHV